MLMLLNVVAGMAQSKCRVSVDNDDVDYSVFSHVRRRISLRDCETGSRSYVPRNISSCVIASV